MKLTSSITDYDQMWPYLYLEEARRLRSVFGDACIDIHHVGSTAVKGLAAKPEIDVLVVVSNASGLEHWQTELTGLGYRRGKDLVEGHHFFKRDVGGIRTHKLHVCVSGHSQISRMLGIRDQLRSDSADRRAYAELKFRLERENRTGIAEYLTGKAPFLDELYWKFQTKA